MEPGRAPRGLGGRSADVLAASISAAIGSLQARQSVHPRASPMVDSAIAR
jgi:hypothetical protein